MTSYEKYLRKHGEMTATFPDGNWIPFGKELYSCEELRNIPALEDWHGEESFIYAEHVWEISD